MSSLPLSVRLYRVTELDGTSSFILGASYTHLSLQTQKSNKQSQCFLRHPRLARSPTFKSAIELTLNVDASKSSTGDDSRSMHHETTIRAAILGGLFYVAVDGDDKIVGTASWFPPGADLYTE